MLSAEAAARILRLHEETGLGEAEFADRIMIAAARSGVAVEFGRRGGAAGESGPDTAAGDAQKGTRPPIEPGGRQGVGSQIVGRQLRAPTAESRTLLPQ